MQHSCPRPWNSVLESFMVSILKNDLIVRIQGEEISRDTVEELVFNKTYVKAKKLPYLGSHALCCGFSISRNSFPSLLFSIKHIADTFKFFTFIENNANIDQEDGEGVLPDVGASDDNGDDVLHPNGHNSGGGGGYTPGENVSEIKDLHIRVSHHNTFMCCISFIIVFTNQN